MYRPIHDPSDQQIFQQDIDTLLHWSHNWQMNFNAKNCYILTVSCKSQKHASSYTPDNITLLSVESFTYLGVTVSSDLRWHKHVATVSAKATLILNLLHRNIYFCTSELEALAFTSLVRPHLEYASAS